MSDGSILYAQKNRRCFIKMTGEIRHTISPGFDALLNRLLGDGQTEDFVIDLNAAVYLDSTNLGILAKIAKRMRQRRGHQPIIVSRNADINTVLHSMGFDRVFAIVEEEQPSEEAYMSTPQVEAGKEERAKLIVDSHKALMEMNDTCKEMFRDVVEMFEQSSNPQ